MSKNSELLSPSCSSSEDLVAYLYGELDAAAQPAFEGHLADCESCAAEFADLSLSRLGVYEWHRDEFVPLALPQITVPYAAAARTSWIEAARAFFSAPARLGLAASAFAVLAVAIGLWFFIPAKTEIAANSYPKETTAPATAPARPEAGPEIEPLSPVTAVPATEPEGRRNKPTAVKAVAVTPARKPTPRKVVRTQSIAPRTEQAKRPVSSPRLNGFDDEEDTTLRLGDLLAEVDTKE